MLDRLYWWWSNLWVVARLDLKIRVWKNSLRVDALIAANRGSRIWTKKVVNVWDQYPVQDIKLYFLGIPIFNFYEL